MSAGRAAVWDFGYARSNAQLEALYTKGKRLQWDADDTLDWDQPVDPSGPILGPSAFPLFELNVVKRLGPSQRAALNAELTSYTLSQFLHGEQGAVVVAGVLLSCCPDLEAKLFAASQVMDEARHVEVFQRYIAKCGAIHTIRPRLKEVLTSTVSADHWVKTLIGVQIVVEGLALATFKSYSTGTNDPLLKSILTNVIRDEARHVGFGVMYVRETLLAMHPDEREAVAEFAYETTMSISEMMNYEQLRDMRSILENNGVVFDDIYKELQATTSSTSPPPPPHPFGPVVVGLLDRVGAITERTRPWYKQARRTTAQGGPSVLDDLDALQ